MNKTRHNINKMIYTDALQREVNLPEAPQRIISLVPSLTELLHDLSLEPQLVGITKYCVHPTHYRATKTLIGGTKKAKYKEIAALNPDFILCSKEENTPEMVAKLEQIAPAYVSDVNSFADALSLINELGLILNRRTEATHIIDRINFRYKEFISSLKDKEPIRVAYFIWANPWMVAGGNTFIDDMLRICKFENGFANKKERYPVIKPKRMRVVANPKLLMFSSEPHDFTDEEVYEVLRLTKKTLTIYVDGEYFSWYGSRLVKAFDHFKQVRQKVEAYFAVEEAHDHDHDHEHHHHDPILQVKKLEKK
jgi:ABC-type Fe3+-hydroxamate transport system substrate-binding protein